MVSTISKAPTASRTRKFPRPTATAPKTIADIEKLAAKLWAESGIDDLISPILEADVSKLKATAPADPGWHRWDGEDWEAITEEDLPIALFVDVESAQIEGHWVATLCVAWGDDVWFAWQGSGLIPSRLGHIFIGHNGSKHDSQFFASEYAAVSADRNLWLDTRSFVELLRGVPSDKRAEFEAFQKSKAKGKGVPGWASKACDANLSAALETVCGITLNKSVKGELFHGEEASGSFFEYCASDVWGLIQLFQTTYPMLRGRIKSNVWWWGTLSTTGLRVEVPFVDESLGMLREVYDDAKKIKPPQRSTREKNIVKWGAAHLRHFAALTHDKGIAPLRVQPGNVDNEISGDWMGWIDGEWAVDADTSCLPMISMMAADDTLEYDWLEDEGGDDIVQVVLKVPAAKIPSDSEARSLATSNPASPLLGVPVPMSIEGVDSIAGWIQRAARWEPFFMMVCEMDAEIERLGINAWLSVPGADWVAYSVERKDAGFLEKI